MDDLMSAFGMSAPLASSKLTATVRRPSATWESASDALANTNPGRKRLMAESVRRRPVPLKSTFPFGEEVDPWACASEHIILETNVTAAAADIFQPPRATLTYLHDDCSVWNDTLAAGREVAREAEDVEFGAWVQAGQSCDAAESVVGNGASSVRGVSPTEVYIRPLGGNPWGPGSAPQKQQSHYSHTAQELLSGRKSLSRDERDARYTPKNTASSGTNLDNDLRKELADHSMAVQRLGPGIVHTGVRASTRSRNPQLNAERAGQTNQVTISVKNIALREGPWNVHAGQRLHGAKSNVRPSYTGVRASAQSRNIQPGSERGGNAEMATIASSVPCLHDNPWAPANQSQSQRIQPFSEGSQAPSHSRPARTSALSAAQSAPSEWAGSGLEGLHDNPWCHGQDLDEAKSAQHEAPRATPVSSFASEQDVWREHTPMTARQSLGDIMRRLAIDGRREGDRYGW